IAAARQAVQGYDYAAAWRILDDLRKRLWNSSAKPPELELMRKWTGVMARWNAFEHAEAARTVRLNDEVRAALEKSGHRDALLRLGERAGKGPGWDLCQDLWLNAQRCGERGRYD